MNYERGKYAVYEDDFIYKSGPKENWDVGWRVDVGKASYLKDRNPLFLTKQEAKEYAKWLMYKDGYKPLNLIPIKRRPKPSTKKAKKDNVIYADYKETVK